MGDSIRTYKIRLKRQFIRRNKNSEKLRWNEFKNNIEDMLITARKIANYVIQPDIKHTNITTKDTKFLGKIKSTIANQIIRKYKNNTKCKKITNVNLIIPANYGKKYQDIIYNEEINDLYIKPLRLHLHWSCPIEFIKINQVELNTKYVYVCVTIANNDFKAYENMIGVDLNIKHNLAAIGNPEEKTVSYLGQQCIYDRLKYKNIRKRFQKQKRQWKIKEMGNKENRYMNDLNHKISHEIVKLANNNNANISFENLTGIRKVSKSFKYFLNSWQFYTLQKFVEYKSNEEGIQVVYVDPYMTSQTCSNCGSINKCSSKKYVCGNCNLHIHRDKNASFNIANKGVQSLLEFNFE